MAGSGISAFALLASGVFAACTHSDVARSTVGNSDDQDSRNVRVTLRPDSSQGAKYFECDRGGQFRPNYFEALAAFAKSHLIQEDERMLKAVMFQASADRPHLRAKYLTTAPLNDGEVVVGIDPRSVTGELLVVSRNATYSYCVYANERAPTPSLEVALAGASVE